MIIIATIALGVTALLTAYASGMTATRRGTGMVTLVVLLLVLMGYEPAAALLGAPDGLIALFVVWLVSTEFYYRVFNPESTRPNVILQIINRRESAMAGLRCGRLLFAVAWEVQPC